MAIQVPADTEVAAGGGAWGVWLFASSFQSVEVTLRYEDGAPFRFIYSGPIGDSLRVQWNGLDAADQLPPVSRVLLRVASRAPTGEGRRAMQARTSSTRPILIGRAAAWT